MKKRLNNKGYMLVEIILASAIAFALAYFMLELTLKVKDRNDYILAATLTATDKTIISNKIMKDLKENENCEYVNGFKYEDLNKYAELGTAVCNVSGKTIHVTIPLKVKKINNNDFNIDLYYLKTS